MTGFLGENNDPPGTAPPLSPVDPSRAADATTNVPEPVPAGDLPAVPVVTGDSPGSGAAPPPAHEPAVVPSAPPPGVEETERTTSN